MTSLTTPAGILGDSPDQSDADALIGPGQDRMSITKEWWGWPGYLVQYDSAGYQTTPYALFFRNPVLHDEARWVSNPSSPEGKTGKEYARIPFDPAWVQGTGTDAGILIIDKAGNYWGIQNARRIQWWNLFENFQLAIRYRGFPKLGDFVCDGYGYSTRANAGLYDGCGAGRMPKIDGLLRAQMVKDGIKTALSMVGISQWGNGAEFSAPATRVECLYAMTPDQQSGRTPQGRQKGIVPRKGARYRLTYTRGEIESWAINRGYTGAKYNTAVAIAWALCEYGWVHKEEGTGRNPNGTTVMQMECEGTINPQVRPLWAELGMVTDDDFTNLLYGLFKRERVRVVTPAPYFYP